MLRRMRRWVRGKPADGAAGYSNLGEEAVIEKHLACKPTDGGFCVDIAANDGLTMSNTYWLYRQGWRGLAVECDPVKFERLARNYASAGSVQLARCMVTPDNVLALLRAHATPIDFELLNLDIDGYDHFVLERLLEEFRPSLICAEINEKIPPPIRFTVNWDPHYAWKMDHFYGQSLTQLEQLLKATGYSLVELHYNNAFLVPGEVARGPGLTAEVAYREGYLDKADRKEKFPWNADMEPLLTMSPEEGIEFLADYFKDYQGRYTLGL